MILLVARFYLGNTLVAGVFGFVEENISSGVTSVVIACFMCGSILAAIFEDKDARAWREQETARMAQVEQRMLQFEKQMVQSNERFSQAMISLGYDVYNLKQTAANAPAAFGPRAPKLHIVNHVCTPTEVEKHPAVNTANHAVAVIKDLGERDAAVSHIRKRMMPGSDSITQ